MYTSGILWKTGDLRMVLDISPCKQQRQQQQQQQQQQQTTTKKQTKTWQEKDIEKTFSCKKHNTIKMQIATESSTTKTRKTRNQNIWGCKQDKDWVRARRWCTKTMHEDDARRRCTNTMHEHEDQGSKLKGQTLITSKPRIKPKLKDGGYEDKPWSHKSANWYHHSHYSVSVASVFGTDIVSLLMWLTHNVKKKMKKKTSYPPLLISLPVMLTS